MIQESSSTFDDQHTESLTPTPRAHTSEQTIEHTGSDTPLSRQRSAGIVRKIRTHSEEQASVFCRQLLEDIRRLSALNCPQIEQIRECRPEGASILIVQDAVAGCSCSDTIALVGKFTERDAIEFLQQVLPLLALLHRKGLSHRNLSPDTLYLRTDGSPVLTQFKFLQDVFIKFGIPFKSTLRDEVLQLTGVAAPRGILEDLQCLALTAILLLTDKPLDTLFDRPTRCWCWQDYQYVSDDFSRIIDQMLSFDAKDWFQSAEEFLFALELAMLTSDSTPSTASSNPFASASSEDFLLTLTPQTRIGVRLSRPAHIQYMQWFAVLGLSAGLATLMFNFLYRTDNRASYRSTVLTQPSKPSEICPSVLEIEGDRSLSLA